MASSRAGGARRGLGPGSGGTPARPTSTARSRKAPHPGVPFSLAVPRVSLAPLRTLTEGSVLHTGVCPARSVCLARWAMMAGV